MATVVEQLRDFVYEELKFRVVLIQDAESIGNPNDSALPKVINAPLGTLYQQSDVTPRPVYIRIDNQNLGEDWLQLSLGFSKDDFDDIKDLIKDCCDKADKRMDSIQTQVNNHTKRIVLLENATFGTPIPPEPIISQSSLDGDNTVDSTTVNQVSFRIDGTGLLAINDVSKIIITPNVLIGTPIIQFSPYGYWELVLNVNLSDGEQYQVDILPDAISNDGITNTSNVTCIFETIGLPKEPKLSPSNLEGLTIDPLTTNKIIFPIVASGTVKLENSKGFQIIPNDISASDLMLVDDGLGNFTLEMDLQNLQLDMNYELKVLANTLSNDGIKNTYVKSSKFKSLPSQPTVLTDSSLDGLTLPSASGITEVLFPITTVTGRGTFNLNSSLITSTPNINIVSSSIKSIGTSKYVSVKVDNIKDGETHVITVGTGAIDNNGLPTLVDTDCSFTVELEEPTVTNSELDSKTDVDHTITAIEFELSGTSTLSIADLTKIVLSDTSILNGSPSIIGSKLTIPVTNLLEDTTYSITIDSGCIENSNGTYSKTNSSVTVCTFTTQSPEPIIGDSSLNTTIDNALTITEVRFPITATGTLSIGNSLAITMIPNVISGLPYIDSGTNELVVPISSLQPDTTYTVSVGIGSVKNNTRENNYVKQCKFTTIDIPSMTMPTITHLDYPTTTIEIELSDIGFTYLGGITTSAGTITSVNITGNKLVVEVGGLSPSQSVNINVPVGCVSNGTETNQTGLTISKDTKGDKPVLNIPSMSSVDSSVTTSIVIPVTFPTIPINVIFDASKIHSVNGIIVGTPTFNSVSNEITINVNLDYDKNYEFRFYSGLINADGTDSDYGELKFGTIVNTSHPTPPTPSIVWQEDFTLPNAKAFIAASTLTNTLNDTLIYGTTGYDHKVKMYWVGYVGNLIHASSPIEVPRTGLDSFNASNPDGSYFYDSGIGMIYFNSASISNKVYRLICYV